MNRPMDDHEGLGSVVAEYLYHDAGGVLLFKVLRFEPKDFRQRRPDGNGGWVPNVNGVPVVPYHLPEVLKAIDAGETIFITEGEKDADALRALGVTATCNAAGACHWYAGHSEWLKGADVVILPDNDAKGREHAESVAASLVGIAATIGILGLPGLPPDGDVSDWIDAGGTVEKLHDLVRQAVSDAIGAWDAGDDDWNIPPRGWLLGTTFCRGFISSILADGGVGKTALRLAQSLAVATGRRLTGEHVFQRSRVLFMSLEDGRDELRRRVRAAMLHHRIEPAELKGWLYLAAPGRDAGALLQTNERGQLIEGGLGGKIRAYVQTHKIDLVDLDPLVKTHRVTENENSAMDFVAQILSDMAIEYDIAVDTPHHTTKGPSDPGNANRGRGASSSKDAARLVYTLSTMSPNEAETFGIEEANRRHFVRMDSAKVNLVPHASAAKWFRLVGVPLGNGTDLYPNGDNVQTVEPWSPPDTWDGLSTDLLNRILTEIDAGLPDGNRYTDGPNAGEREAWNVVARHAEKSDAQCRDVIRQLVKNHVLERREYINPVTRKAVRGLYLNAANRPGNVSS